MTLRIMVDDRATWLQLYDKLRDLGFLKDISREDMDLSEDLFPMELFIDIDPILALVESPMVKLVRKKIDGTLTKTLEEAIL